MGTPSAKIASSTACPSAYTGGWTAGEDERGRSRRDLVRRQPVADELRWYTGGLAHPPRDQLAVLASEIDDENGTRFRLGLRGREADDVPN